MAVAVIGDGSGGRHDGTDDENLHRERNLYSERDEDRIMILIDVEENKNNWLINPNLVFGGFCKV